MVSYKNLIGISGIASLTLTLIIIWAVNKFASNFYFSNSDWLLTGLLLWLLIIEWFKSDNKTVREKKGMIAEVKKIEEQAI